jgi:hypothetical protein
VVILGVDGSGILQYEKCFLSRVLSQSRLLDALQIVSVSINPLSTDHVNGKSIMHLFLMPWS